MKILIVHNSYGRYSGEEAVVERTAAMFRSLGHEVDLLRRTTEGLRDTLGGKVHGFLCGLYSPGGVKAMREALRREQPDVVNIHNLYPFISPAALFECRKAGVPVVMTVHNFRLICPTGLFMRNGQPCELCLQRGNEWGCVRYNCEQSMMKSVGYAARNAVARWTGAYKKCVTRYACITDFQRQKLIEAGFEPERLTVIPNVVDAPDSYTPVRGDYVAYLGRLSYEKGYDLLIEVARRHPEIRFRFAGAQRKQSAESSSPSGDLPDNVEMAGYLTGDDLQQFISHSRFICMPSRCYEGFPMVILECAQHGKPTIGPNHGGFTDIIGKGDAAIGRLFRPGDVDDLEQQIVNLWNTPDECARLGAKAFEKLTQNYSTETAARQWAALLEEVIKTQKS